MTLKRSDKWVSGLRPTAEEGSNPKDELGMLKVPLALVSPTASVIQALCMADGEAKYGPYNYRVAKVQARIYLEACLRHIQALLDGEDFDIATGKPHIGYALATAQIYCDAWVNGFLIDNRPLPGKAGALMNFLARAPGQAELSPNQIRNGILEIIGQQPSANVTVSPFSHGGFRANVNDVGGWGETPEKAIENAAQNAQKQKAAAAETLRPAEKGPPPNNDVSSVSHPSSTKAKRRRRKK